MWFALVLVLSPLRSNAPTTGTTTRTGTFAVNTFSLRSIGGSLVSPSNRGSTRMQMYSGPLLIFCSSWNVRWTVSGGFTRRFTVYRQCAMRVCWGRCRSFVSFKVAGSCWSKTKWKREVGGNWWHGKYRAKSCCFQFSSSTFILHFSSPTPAFPANNDNHSSCYFLFITLMNVQSCSTANCNYFRSLNRYTILLRHPTTK